MLLTPPANENSTQPYQLPSMYISYTNPNHMKKTTFTICLLFICFIHYAQLPKHAIQAIAGYSKHGSGDMDGIVFGAEYISYKTDKFSLNYNFRSTINHSKHEILIMDQSGNLLTDASIRFTTAALQLGVNAGWSVIRNNKNEFLISLGAFGRYQSASNGSDGYSLYSPAVTGQPTYLVGYDNRTEQNTIAAG